MAVAAVDFNLNVFIFSCKVPEEAEGCAAAQHRDGFPARCWCGVAGPGEPCKSPRAQSQLGQHKRVAQAGESQTWCYLVLSAFFFSNLWGAVCLRDYSVCVSGENHPFSPKETPEVS